jgi:hypothetical protein
VRLLEVLALLELRRIDEAVPVFSEALSLADALLALADRNVAALQARALALSGLAAAGDPTRAIEAAAVGRADIATNAAGAQADTSRLLDRIAAHDPAGLLTETRAAQDRS